MLRLIQRQLDLDRLRTVLTAIAIAAVIAVILVLEGFHSGLRAQSRDAVLARGADLVVTQAGVANLHAARSVLPQFTRRDVEAVEGVAAAHPMTGILTIYLLDGRRTPVYLLVHDDVGGPRRLLAGSGAATARDIVIDRSLARIHGLQPGDPFVVSDFEFRVSGIAAGAAALFTPFAFIRFDGLIDFYFESDLAADISTFPLLSYLLVELLPGADRDAVAARIEAAVPDGDVFTPERLADNDVALVVTMLGPVFGLLISVGYLIGVLVIAIIMFAAVHARRRAFGLLKALGFTNAFLAFSVVGEAVALTLVAIPAGIALAAGVAALVGATMPLYLVLPLEVASVLQTAAAALVFAIVGALVPIQMIRRLEPDLVFRS